MSLAATLSPLLLAFVWVSGCTQLPSGAPKLQNVAKEAAQDQANFAFFSVTEVFLNDSETWRLPPVQPYDAWPKSSDQGIAIRPGDQLSVRVWDNSDNSLLSVSGQRAAQLQDIDVAENGEVFFPYVGVLTVVGQSAAQLRSELQSRLEVLLPGAQVQLDHKAGSDHRFDLVTGVIRPGSYPVPVGALSVLSALALGGGVARNLKNPWLYLRRDGRIYRMPMAQVSQASVINRTVQAGDQIWVEADPEYFLTYGANGRENLHWFPKADLRVMEAISLAGGVDASAANSRGLLLLRRYAVVPEPRIMTDRNVVFAFDLTRAEGLFAAQRFEVVSGDLLVATEAGVRDVAGLSRFAAQILSVFETAGDL